MLFDGAEKTMTDYKRGVRWAYAIIFGLCLLCLGVSYTEPECVRDRDCDHHQRCIDGVCKVKP